MELLDGCSKPIFCFQHAETDMINVLSKRCKTFLCDTQVNNTKYDGYCMHCYIHLFPDKPVPWLNYKTKERSVVDHVLEQFPDQRWVADKQVQDGCSKRRPDLLLDLGYQILIVEIDENQHITYDCSCENKRLMELSADVGHRPIVFIRFNPDDYRTNEGNVTSCWGIDGNGICVVKKSKRNEWQDRLSALTQTIAYWMHPDHQTNKTIEVIPLFYDVVVTTVDKEVEVEEPPFKRPRPNDVN